MLKLLLAPFKVLFNVLGVNYHQLYTILKVKLMMDNRKASSFSQSKSKSSKYQMLNSSIAYIIMGAIFVFFMVILPSSLLAYTVFFAMIMVMIAFAMISEFTTLLFDVRDNAILGSRPINNATLAAVKVFHIAIYLLQISLSVSLGVAIYTLVKFGVMATLLFLLLLVFNAFFVLFLTNIFYFLLSNLVTAQRLKDIVIYMQITMAVLFMGAYQLLPRLMEHYDIKNMGEMVLQWWQLCIPPVWISGTLDMVIHHTCDIKHIVFMIFAIVVPIICLVLVVKVLSPRFNKAVLNEEKITDNKKAVKQTINRKGLVAKLANIFSSNQQEAACFFTIWKMSGRERKYKQTAFPMFGYLFIFIAMYLFKSGEQISLSTLQESNRYMIFLYFPMILSYNLIYNLSFTEHPKSSWFFRAMPIKSAGIVLRAALKSIFIKYFLPTFILIASCCFYIWGVDIVDHIILAFLVNFMVMVLIQRNMVKTFPFTIEKGARDMGSNFLRGMLLMIGILCIFGIVYLLDFLSYAILIAAVLVAIINFFLLKGYDKIKLEQMH